MAVINLMLGSKRGGIEQAVLDYAQALQAAGIAALSIVPPNSWAAQQCAARGLPHATLKQWGGWDRIAAWKLARQARAFGARAIICHGNRALSLALHTPRAFKKIAVAHNYKTRRFHQADACFAITQHAANALAARGIARKNIFYMPNLALTGTWHERPAFRTPPVIGSMGRFVKKKGFDLYLDALALLKQRGVTFTALLGGTGEEEQALRAHCRQRNLDDRVTFTGWVDDKTAFFDRIDLFVLPSHHEPFGIVMAEAMAAGLPFVSTASEGPSEVIKHGENGLLTPLADAAGLADALTRLLRDETLARKLGRQAYETIRTQYSLDAMARRLKGALPLILTGN